VLIHLYSNQQAYGDSEVWCGTDEQYKRGEVGSAADIAKATCQSCLRSARVYGDGCAVRLEALLAEESRARRNAIQERKS
jgi:hypothetical protein